MSRTFLLVSLTLLAALAAFWLSARDALPAAPATAGPATEQTQTVPATALLEADRAGQADRAEDSVGLVAPNSASAEAREAVGDEETPTIEASPSEGLELQVVESSSARPVAHAKVTLLAEAALLSEDLLRILATGFRIDRVLSDFGREFRADESGRLYLPPFRDTAIVAAEGEGHSGDGRSGYGLFGWRKVAWEEPAPARLELTPSSTVRVRVVDSAGRARVGVPVALRLWRDEDQWLDALTEETDKRGHAVLRHLPQVIDLIGAGSEPKIALSVPLAEPVARALDLEHLPEERVELVLPPTGALEVELLDAEGMPAPLPCYVGVKIVPAEQEIPAKEFFDYGSGVTVQWAPEGRTRFAHVAADVPLAVAVQFADGRPPVVQRVEAPLPQGGLTRVEVLSSPPIPILSIRLETSDGRALASTRLDTYLIQQGADGSPQDVVAHGAARTDEAGEFLIGPGEKWEPGSLRRVDIYTRAEEGELPLFARVDYSFPLAAGVTQIDCLAQPLPDVASGFVLDGEGRPIRGARLRLYELGAGAASDRPWLRVPNVTATSGAGGEFVVHAVLDTAQLALEARHSQYRAPERLEFARGASGLELRMIGVGGLAGAFQLDPDVGRPRLSFRLRSHTRETRTRKKQELGDDGSFELSGLMEGRYDLEIFFDSEDERLLTVPEVVIRAGETTRDPRLASVDLRGSLRRIMIDVESDGGESIYGLGLAVRRPTSEDSSWKTRLYPGAQLELFTTEPFLELEISARGHRPQWLEQVADDRRVILEEGLPLRVRLSGGTSPMAAGETFVLHLQPTGGSRPWHVGGAVQAELDASGEVRLSAPGNGRFQALLRLRRKGAGTAKVSHAEQYFEVLEVSHEQRFRLEVSRDALRAAREELEPR